MKRNLESGEDMDEEPFGLLYGDRPYDNYEEYLEDLFAEMDIFPSEVRKSRTPVFKKTPESPGA